MRRTRTRLEQISYENTYAHCILTLEKFYAKTKGKDGKKLRPPLPIDVKKIPSRTDTSAFKPILTILERHGPMTSKDIAVLLKKNSHKICGTMRHAVDAGYVTKKSHVRRRDAGEGYMDCWLYQIAS